MCMYDQYDYLLKNFDEIKNVDIQVPLKKNLEFFPVKGSVSRVLRWVLLYINQKLFSRPIIAFHKILTFLKGQFTINKKQVGAPLYYDNIEIAGKWVFPQY